MTPSPLVVAPFEAKVSVAAPLTAPAVAVLIPTLRLVLSVEPAARLVNEPPLVVIPVVAPPMLAFSPS